VTGLTFVQCHQNVKMNSLASCLMATPQRAESLHPNEILVAPCSVAGVRAAEANVIDDSRRLWMLPAVDRVCHQAMRLKSENHRSVKSIGVRA
jgi:hypothetical protein